MRMSTCAVFLLSVTIFFAGMNSPRAEGHGPTFALATPTLAKDAWSSDTVGMWMSTQEGDTYRFREMIGYGLNEDLQFSLTFPLSSQISKVSHPPRTRVGAMMGGFGDIEPSLLWRFQRRAPAVGTRYESALFVSGSLPTEDKRGGVAVGPGVNAAAVTGYASRTIYWWMGGGFQRYFERGNDRLGDLPYLSAVFGWRPPLFREDYPKPDWRIFIESLAEFPRRDRIDNREVANSGGQKVLLGPSLLGLYGKWGMELGVLFPVSQDLNGSQPEEKARSKLVLTYWF